MFNRGQYNEMPFNRVLIVDVLIDFAIDHRNTTSFTGNVQVLPSFEIDHTLSTEFAALRDRIAGFVTDLLQSMDFSAVRERTGGFTMFMQIEHDFAMSQSQVLTLTFAGGFKPGDRILIDSDKLKMTKNGVNALQDMDGDFISLYVGENRLSWTDDRTQRNVRIRVDYRDRFM